MTEPMIKVGQIYQDTNCGCIDRIVDINALKSILTVEVLRGCYQNPDNCYHATETFFSEDIDSYLSHTKLVPKVKAVLYE